MKKRTLKIAVFSLMMTALLFNCKDKDDNKDPDKPNTDITKELDDLKVTPITIDQPATVAFTDAKIEASAKATEVNGALSGIGSSGSIPGSVSGAASDVSGAISASEISSLNSISSETISAVAAGGTLSPELKAILDKAQGNPAVSAYLPKFTLPTVGGVEIKGARIAANEDVAKVDNVLVSDACVDAANATFATAKTRLDAGKAAEVVKVNTAYEGWIAPIAAGLTSCNQGLVAKYADYRTSAQQTANGANASLDAAQGTLGNLYPVLKALVNIQLLGALSSINTLEAADKQACTAKSTAATAAADAAKATNLSKVDAAYTTALAEATRLKGLAVASCHNQGGGN